MILKQTDDYTFVRGHAAILRNNAEGRHERWVRAEPGTAGSIIWCYFETPFWLAFDGVVDDEEARVVL